MGAVMTAFRSSGPSLLAIVLVLTGCVHHVAHPASVAGTANDNSFMDLEAGWRLCILVPLVSSAVARPKVDSEREEGGTIVITTRNPAGYELFFYHAEARGRGKVQLRFVSAEWSKMVKAFPNQASQRFRFRFPPNRLIFD